MERVKQILEMAIVGFVIGICVAAGFKVMNHFWPDDRAPLEVVHRVEE